MPHMRDLNAKDIINIFMFVIEYTVIQTVEPFTSSKHHRHA